MSNKCSMCKVIFLNHLNFISSILCGQEGCIRKYQNLESFRKHLIQLHSPTVQAITVPDLDNQNNT